MTSTASGVKQQDQAYILHTRPYRNTSLLVEAFCAQYGRLDFVVKGVKRKDSPMQGLIQPFTALFIVWGGRSDLKNLYQAEAIPPRLQLSGDYLYAGFYINELIMYLLHKHEAHSELFLTYQQCLMDLSAQHDLETVLRYFELDLLNELGYGLNLCTDAQTGAPIVATQTYQFDLNHGFSLYRGDDQSIMSISGDTLNALERRTLNSKAQKSEAKKLLRRVLEYYLEGKPIRTRELLYHKNKILSG